MMAALMNIYYGAGEIIRKTQGCSVCDVRPRRQRALVSADWPGARRISMAEERGRAHGAQEARSPKNGTGPSPVDAETKDREEMAGKRDLGRGWGRRPRGRGAGSGIDTAVDQLMARESPVRVPVRQKKGDGRSDQAMSSRCRQRRSRIGGWWHRMISGSSRFRLLVAQGEAGRLCRCGCGGCVWWWSGGVVGGSTAVSRVG